MEGEEDKLLAFHEVQFLFSVKCDKDIFRKNTLVFWWRVESFPGVFQGIIITRTETRIYYIANIVLGTVIYVSCHLTPQAL